MLAEILTIGDELCRGEIVDGNSSWLAARLWDLGIATPWMVSCGDDADAIQAALRQAAGRADVILASGGLGPTSDDLTVDAVARLVGREVVVEPAAAERMRRRFERAGFTLTPNNMRQVRVPEGAESLGNPAGLAPGFTVPVSSAQLYVMPGVPREMQAIFESAVQPRLAAAAASGERVARRLLRVFGVGESHIDHRLAGLVDGVAGATIHYQVLYPETLVKLVVRDRDPAAAQQRVDALAAGARARLGEAVYGEGDDSLAAALGRALGARGATLAVAESCTGGMIGSLVTDVPGSSDYFLGGIIAYANEVKVATLGVRPETLARAGAVSEECVREMAAGARRLTGATVAAAVSGVAGPGGGTDDKPVGTVHVAVDREGGGRHKRYVFPGARDQVRRLAAYWAMAMVIKEVRS